MELTHGIPLAFRGGIHLYYTANRHRVSPEFIRPRHCVSMSFSAESAVSCQDTCSSSNGCCLDGKLTCTKY